VIQSTRLGRALGPGNLVLVQRGSGPPTWTLRWSDERGVRRQKSLSTDRRIAERRMREIIHRRDLALEGVGVDGRDIALSELARLYLDELRSRCTDEHYTNSKSIIERALVGVGVHRVGDLLPLHALKYRTHLVSQGAAARTANLAIDRLSAMLAWGVKAGLLHKNPLAQIDRLRDTGGHARYQRRALSADEITRLLEAVDAEDREQAARVRAEAASRSARTMRHRGVRVPQRLLFQALIETGARWGELTATTWADLDADKAVLRLRAPTTKARKQRLIPLRRALVDELLALRPVHAASRGRAVVASDRILLTPEGADWSRPTNNAARILHRAFERAGIERVDSVGHKLDLHALRHSAATRWARSGVPLVHAQALLGHSDVRLTSKVYTHVAVEDLRGAVEAVGG
jgi:integrase